MATYTTPSAQTLTPTAVKILAQIRATMGQRSDLDFEFSIQLRPGTVADRGRFTIWCPPDDAGIEQMTVVLCDHGAPASVREALRRLDHPVRSGFGVALATGGPEYRLYLHDRIATTSADRYRAWKWRPNGPVGNARYAFYYFPETPEGERPESLFDAELQSALDRLLSDDRLRRASGFWLRRRDDGRVDQLDLAFPWSPPARTIPGLVDFARRLGVAVDHPSGWADLCARHVAFSIGSPEPKVTLYASAPARGAWPASEGEFQDVVRRRSRAHHIAIESQIFSALPDLPPVETASAPLGRFYDGEIELWKRLLGPELHYHHGLFEKPEREPDDAAMDAALRRAVTDLYPFIPRGSRVYDVGCGWGGPLAMLVRDLGCVGLGLTVSRKQFQYVSRLGLPVRWGDAERTFPPGQFDCAVLLESFEHVLDKESLLRVLRAFTSRLVMRVNCQDVAPPGAVFGDTMHMIASRRLREILDGTGWQIHHWRNRRDEALPSVAVWGRRIRAVPARDDAHAEALRAWCERVLANHQAWAQANPLIEVVAERAD